MCIHVLHVFCNFLCVKSIYATQKFHLIFIVRTNLLLPKGREKGEWTNYGMGLKYKNYYV